MNLWVHHIAFVGILAGVFSRKIVPCCWAMSSKNTLSSVFRSLRTTKQIFILDGGTGEELIRRGVPDDRKIWSAIALVNPEHHSTLEGVHRSYLDSGSHAVTTNSYGVVPGVGFVDTKERSTLLDVSGTIARQAVVAADTKDGGFVFGSLGPLIESYRADMIKPHEEGVKDYEIACRALSRHVDAYLAETMSCVEESMQVVEAVGNLQDDEKRPLLVSYTLTTEGNFRDDEEVTKGIQRMLEFSHQKEIELLAILFNCVKPEAITLALEKIKADNKLKQGLRDANIVLGAYANRLTDVDPNWTLADSEEPQPFRKDLDTEKYGSYIEAWVDRLDLKIVGGCCGIFPEDIRYIRQKLGNRAVVESV